MDPSSPEAASKFMTTGPEHYQALHKRCSSALSQWKEPSKAKKCVGNEYHNYGPSLQNQGKGHSCVPGPSGLLSIGIEMNQSDLSSASGMNQLVARDDTDIVASLVALARGDPDEMA